MVLVPLLLSLLLPLVSTQTTYHIKPTAESLCTYGNSLTLSESVKKPSRYFNSDNLTLVFLTGEHTLNDSIVSIADLGNLKLLGSNTFHYNVSTIQRTRDSGVILKNITIAEIAELCF